MDLTKGVVGWAPEDRDELSNAVRRGKALRLFPRAYVDRGLFERCTPRQKMWLRQRAAMRYLGGKAVLSHATAVDLWDLRPQQPDEHIHATVGPSTRLRSGRGLIVHSRRDFPLLKRTWRHGLAVLGAAEAVAGAWPVLPPADRRRVVIEAVRKRLATADRIKAAMSPRVTGVKELRQLLGLLAAGCESELEIWGAIHVFTESGMPAFRRQFPVAAGGRIFRLDVYAEQERVAFELDGAAFHGDQIRRESDIRRDALLATLGIQVVRFSYRRLMSEPDAVRREILAILRSRQKTF